MASTPDLRLPSFFRRPLTLLAKVPERVFTELQEALERLDPALAPDRAAESLEDLHEVIELPQLIRVLEFATSTRALTARWGHPSEVVAQAVVNAFHETDPDVESGGEGQETDEVLLSRVERLLACHYVVYHEKAVRLTNSADLTIRGVRCISDLRPVFSEESKEFEVEGFLILHMLEVEVSGANDHKTLYLNLDDRTLTQLLATIERAVNKSRSLGSLVGRTGYPDLTPDGVD